MVQGFDQQPDQWWLVMFVGHIWCWWWLRWLVNYDHGWWLVMVVDWWLLLLPMTNHADGCWWLLIDGYDCRWLLVSFEWSLIMIADDACFDSSYKDQDRLLADGFSIGRIGCVSVWFVVVLQGSVGCYNGHVKRLRWLFFIIGSKFLRWKLLGWAPGEFPSPLVEQPPYRAVV